MGATVVFKQSYRPRTVSTTRVLNLKHLEYITTRPGVMKNPGCGFGCFGKLADMKSVGNINDLRIAQKEISEASQNHTIYRAILSVSKDTAEEHNLYDREEWEKLLRSNMSTIAMEMHIKQSDLRWAAAVHYKKDHPHVHIMYWDASKEPKREFVNQDQFKEVSDHVRASFAAKILHGEELKSLAVEKDSTVQATRKQLAALFLTANAAEALNIDKISPDKLDALGSEMVELAVRLPKKGSLKYDYLPEKYKERLNTYLDHVLELGEFTKLRSKYETLSADISKLYGNTGELAAHYTEAAQRALKKELGNEALKYLPQIAEEFKTYAKQMGTPDLYTAVAATAKLLGTFEPGYADILASMPQYRTPVAELMKDEQYRQQINDITKDLTNDVRIRAKVDAYLKAIDADEETRKEVNKAVWKAVRDEVIKQLKIDTGYAEENKQEVAMSGLITLFRFLSQRTGQMQNQKDIKLSKYRNLSETAKKDLRKEREQKGSWELE